MPEETQIMAVTTSAIAAAVTISCEGMCPWDDVGYWLDPKTAIIAKGGEKFEVPVKVSCRYGAGGYYGLAYFQLIRYLRCPWR